MKTVYITGAAGLIGSELVRTFCYHGYKVKACDNLIGGLASNLTNFIDQIDYKEFDVNNYALLKEHMKGSDYVFHCAALAYEGLSVFSPKAITDSVVGATLSVASSCIANKVEKLINFSSMARYGDQISPFTEDMPKNPVDPYGLAKVQAEEHLELLNKLHGLNYFTVVPHNVIGIGQRYMDPYRNVVAIMINRVLSKHSIIIYGDGEQKRSFSNVRDCSDAILSLVLSDKNLTGEVFNIGPDHNEVTIKELALKIGKYCEVQPIIEHYPDRPTEVKNAWCSSDKIKKQFNYNTKRDLDTTIKEMIAWVRERGPEPFNYNNVQIEFTTDQTPEVWTKQKL